jgi:hypothetical protein
MTGHTWGLRIEVSTMRTALATACVAVALGAGLAACKGSDTPTAQSSTSDSPAASSAAPTPSPSRSVALGPPATTPIPDAAFFKPPANRTHEAPAKPENGRGEMPKLCGARRPSDAQIGKQRNRHIVFHGVNVPDGYIPDGTVSQTISVYRPGGAVAAMAELRAAVAACPSEKLSAETTVTYKILPPYALGDDALLVEQTWSTTSPEFPSTPKSLLAAVRIGDAVTTLWVTGWEGIDADPAVAGDYSRLAAQALQNWRS